MREPIISDELFERVQELRSKELKTKSGVLPLRQL